MAVQGWLLFQSAFPGAKVSLCQVINSFKVHSINSDLLPCGRHHRAMARLVEKQSRNTFVSRQ